MFPPKRKTDIEHIIVIGGSYGGSDRCEKRPQKYKLTESASRLNKDAKFLSKLDKRSEVHLNVDIDNTK